MRWSVSVSLSVELMFISNIILWYYLADHKELGHAKVILNDGTYYGNIVRNGGWVM